ncbi:hypothetical protein DL765_008918 [Monosporascus sp. GIB2]|nr:hypothetical protein DL765_008918 [Monosporascus sp. GIB2]
MDHNNRQSILSPTGSLVKHIESQRVRTHLTKSLPTFYRNIEEALDTRRATQSLFSIVPNNWQTKNAVDFCSNDYLSWNTTGLIRSKFLHELSLYPDFSVAAGGSRVMEGNYPYIEETEQEIASFHGAEAGLIVNSAFDANVMVWSALPRPGDAIVYDALVHASTHEGMERSLAIQKTEFQHNDIESFRETLVSIMDSQPRIKQGRRSILVAVESVYSMEGDVCPLAELVEVAKEISQGQGNIQFVIDETHSTGLFGPNGTGIVCELGLEDEIAGQDNVQFLAQTFFKSLTSHPLWPTAQEKGVLSVPLADGWEERPFLTHIVTISTRQKYIYWIYLHLLSASFYVLPVKHPVVPIEESRLRVTFHAENTAAQVVALVEEVFAWVEEIMLIEEGATERKITRAANEVYEWMEREGLKGFGMP